MAHLLDDDLITYDEDCDTSKITHIVDVRHLEDGDLIPVGTLILAYWPMWGYA